MSPKPGALFLVFLPPLTVVLSRRFDILRRLVFWIPPAVVVLFCAPWFLSTREFTGRGLLPASFAGEFGVAWKEYAGVLAATTGLPVLLVAVAGGLLVLLRPAPLRWMAIAAQPLAVGLLLALAPVYIEKRYAIVAAPCVLLLACYACRHLLRKFGVLRAAYAPVIGLVLASAFVGAKFPAGAADDGLAKAADYLAAAASADSVLMVSAAGSGEVRMVAELARREPKRPGRITLRGNKVLAAADWNRTHYDLLFNTEGDVLEEMRRRGVTYALLFDNRPDGVAEAHHQLLSRALKHADDEWRVVYESASDARSRNYRIYKRTHPLSVSPS